MPQISVIIPAYRPRSFAGLLQSMADNAAADAEWIVVDDGSGPAFDAVYAELEGTPARVIRQPQNRRQGAARNAGLAQACGQWVKFLDADDRLDEGHLSALLAAARNAPGGAIPFAPTRHVFSGGGSSVNESWNNLPAASEAQLERLLHRPFLHHCGALFPRELLVDLGGYDEALVTDEDGDLLLRVLMSGAYFFAVPQVQYHYVHHGDERVSSDTGPAKLAARLRVCEKIEAAFAEAGREMPIAVRHGLALRLDKIALAWWDEDRAAARGALDHARALCPNYRPDARLPLRALRALGGPGAMIGVARLYRMLRGRPAGGAQG